MKKMFPVLLLGGLLLAGCGNGGNGLGMLGNRVAVDPQVNDGNSQVTVTKTITPAVPPSGDKPGTPASEKTSVGEAGAAQIVFHSRPTSDAVYLTGYRVTRDVVYRGGKSYDITPKEPKLESVRVYVPSGWSCAEASATQSCNFYTGTGALRTDVVPANGVPSTAYLINISSDLAQDAIATQSSVSRSMDLEFVGTSASGQAVTVPVRGIAGGANFVVAQQ